MSLFSTRLNKNISKSVLSEIGTARLIEDLGCSQACLSFYRSACPLFIMKFFFLKYPNLISWNDFNVRSEKDLERFINKSWKNSATKVED